MDARSHGLSDATEPGREAATESTCVSCGASIPAGLARCTRCGEPVARGERKLVTLLFADLTGYTALAGRLDPEDVYSFVRPAMTSLRLIVEDYGGTVPQVMGDGFMAVFGAPVSHEDDAERAVRAALAIIQRARELNEGRTRERLPPVHAGVNTGEVLVASSREASGLALVGNVVNVASRLADLAPSGRILVGERTRALTEHAIRYRRRRLRRAKGKPEPIATYEPVEAMSPSPVGRLPTARRTPFVGRRAVLAQLQEAMDEAARVGQSRVRLISGEAGMGKTRLAAEFRDANPRLTILAGRCRPYGQRFGHAPLAEGLRELAGIATNAAPEVAEAGVRRFLRRLARRTHRSLDRQVRYVLGTASPGDPIGSEPPGPEGWPAIRDVLMMLASRGPAVVLIDDLQWADPELLDILERAHAAPWGAPLLFVGLGRPELREAAAELPTVELDAFDAVETQEMIRAALGPAIPEPIASRLVTRSSGNPLYLEESIQMLVEAGALVDDGGWQVVDAEAVERVPASLRLLIAARLDGLSSEEKRILQDASVAGQVVWDRLVEQLSGGPAVAGSLARLEVRGLLRRRGASRVRDAVELEFKHALIRDVAYESLPRAERAAKHRVVADWLGDNLERPSPGALAHHYEQAWILSRSPEGRSAAPPEVGLLAARYLCESADDAFAYQPRRAEQLYDRGLRVGRSIPDVTGPTLTAELLIGRAQSLIELGRHREALTVAGRARAAAGRSGSPRLRAYALVALGRAHSYLGQVKPASRLLGEALSIFEAEGDALGQARTYHRLAETTRFDDFPREVEHYERAQHLYARAGAQWEQAAIAQDLATLLTVQGGEAFEAAYRDARRLAEHEGDIRAQAGLLRTAAYHAYYRGLFAPALDAARDARPLAADAGDRWIEVETMLIEAMVQSAIGPPAEAERNVQRVTAIADEVGARHLRALALTAGALPALRKGRPVLAVRRVREARRILDSLGVDAELAEVELTEAAVQLDRGAWGRVRAVADAGEARARRNEWRLLEPLGPLLRGRAHLGAGRARDARVELEHGVQVAEAVEAVGLAATGRAALTQARLLLGEEPGPPGPDPSDPVGRALSEENRAFAAWRAGDPGRAVSGFAAAAERWTDLGLTIWLARAQLLEAQALRRAGRSAAARRVADEAHSVAHAIRAPTGSLALSAEVLA